MKPEYVPLLRLQRDLYGLPRGWERFQTYLAEMVDPQTRDLKLPLVSMNPMGKEHLPALLDEYLAQNADEAAAQTVAATSLHDVAGTFKVTLVLADDAQGGWTNRYATEFSHRVESKAYHRRGWLTGVLWTSEPPSAQVACEAVLTAVHRAAHIERHGWPVTLREILAQEGYAMARAGCTQPTLDADDLEYTRAVLAAYLDATTYRTLIVCLFGDKAARSLGYAPLGLTARAGLARALHDAKCNG